MSEDKPPIKLVDLSEAQKRKRAKVGERTPLEMLEYELQQHKEGKRDRYNKAFVVYLDDSGENQFTSHWTAADLRYSEIVALLSVVQTEALLVLTGQAKHGDF